MKTIIATTAGTSLGRMISTVGVSASTTPEIANLDATMKASVLIYQSTSNDGFAPQHRGGLVAHHATDATDRSETSKVSGVFIYSPRL